MSKSLRRLKKAFSQVQNPVREAGFTLVELLIVIVIIGILAGVVIGVLNPVQQQNRARDGAMRSNITKMALAAKSLQVSSVRTTNKAPTPDEFIKAIGNVGNVDTCTNTTPATPDDPSDTESCHFQVQGITLPGDCVAAGTVSYNDEEGSDQCNFLYHKTPDSFNVAARGAANPKQVFVYSYVEDPVSGSVDEGFYACAVAYDVITGVEADDCTLIN